MPKISIISANLDSPEWAELLIKSVRKFTTMEYEIIIIDNGSLPENLTWLEQQSDISLIKLLRNIGHGGAIDLGTQIARGEYIVFLDIDSHIQRKDWDRDLRLLWLSDNKIRLIGIIGPEHKPLHPPLFFYKREFMLENNIIFRYMPRISTDTAQKAYWDIINLGFKVERLQKGEKTYNCIGDEIHLGGESTIFHMWYGTRFNENNPERKKDKLDGYTLKEHLKNKAQLFEHPKVKEILK